MSKKQRLLTLFYTNQDINILIPNAININPPNFKALSFKTLPNFKPIKNPIIEVINVTKNIKNDDKIIFNSKLTYVIPTEKASKLIATASTTIPLKE